MLRGLEQRLPEQVALVIVLPLHIYSNYLPVLEIQEGVTACFALRMAIEK